jgi:tripartite-type tricarboxylate transporter receptor subunit TctC
MRSRWLRRLVVLILAFVTLPAAAQDFPTRPIRIVVGFPPGGGVDLVARLIGQEMAKGLGQPVIVENKPGAAGTLGANFVAKSEPDGYTLLVTPGGHALFGAVFKSLPFDTVAMREQVARDLATWTRIVEEAQIPRQ